MDELNKKRVLRKIIKAKSALILDEPFFGSLVYRLEIVPDMAGIPTFGTDGKILAYDSEFADSLTFDETIGVLCHEILHVANGHPWRRDGRDKEDFNIACLALGTAVEMADGKHRQIEDIRLGELVASPEGPSRVLGVKYSGVQPVISIHSSGRSLFCTDNHQILTTKGLLDAKYSDGVSALQRRFQATPGSRSIRAQELPEDVTYGTQSSERSRILKRIDVSSDARVDGRSLYDTAMELSFVIKALQARSSLFSGNRRWEWPVLLQNALVWLSGEEIVALDPALFSRKGTTLPAGLEAYCAAQRATKERLADGRYVRDCLATSGIESTGIAIRRGSEACRPVFDLVTEKGLIFAEGLIVHNCDFAIDPLVEAAKKTLPKGKHINPAWLGKSAEWIYGEVHREKQPGGKVPPGGDYGPGGFGEVMDDTSQDAQSNQADWQVAVVQAATIAKAQGKLPAGLERLVESITHPKIDWKAALRRFVQRHAKHDYSWRRPNRRYLTQGIYLPSVMSETIPPMAYGWDMSGSRDEDEARAECMAELVAMFYETCPEKLYVLSHDTKVYEPIGEYEPGDPIEDFKPKGGGGTDFRCLFQYIEDNGLEIACMIIVTDLMGTFPDQEPGYPVLWISTTDLPAPFGEVIRL